MLAHSQARAPSQGPALSTRDVPQQEASRGNAALLEDIGPGIGSVQSALDEHTESASVSMGGTLPGGRILGGMDGHTVRTQQDTRFTVGLARWGAWATFHPPLKVRPATWWQRAATGGIEVSRLDYRFQDGQASVQLDCGVMGDILDFIFGLEDDLATTFADAIEGALPAELRQGGFDPYTEPDLAGKLQRIATQLASVGGSSGGSELSDVASLVQRPELMVSVSPKAMEMDLGDDLKLVVGPRASASLTARFDGTLDAVLASPRVKDLLVRASDIEVEHKVAGKLASVGIQNAVLGADLSVQSFHYSLSTESLLTGLKALAMVLQLRTGQDLGVRDTREVELQGIRAMIDEKVQANLPAMLREQVEAHRHAIPGLDLGQVLDLGGQPGA